MNEEDAVKAYKEKSQQNYEKLKARIAYTQSEEGQIELYQKDLDAWRESGESLTNYREPKLCPAAQKIKDLLRSK